MLRLNGQSSDQPYHFHAIFIVISSAPLLRGVCVYHLNRCKTSIFCRGAVNLIPSTAQRRRWFEIVISGLIIPTYLLQFHVHFLQWDVANPRTTTPFPNNLFFFPRLHGFRNLNYCRLFQMEQLLLAEAKQGLLFDLSQIVSSILSCQV